MQVSSKSQLRPLKLLKTYRSTSNIKLHLKDSNLKLALHVDLNQAQ